MLNCKNTCSAASRKGEKAWTQPHYHCFGCGNLFRRNRALAHYRTHCSSFGDNPSATVPLPSISLSDLRAEPPVEASSEEPTEDATIDVDEPPEDAGSAGSDDHTMMTTLRFVGPRIAPFERSTTPRSECPHCKRHFHPHALKQHIASQHSSIPPTIGPSRYHPGICVDEREGLFLVRKNRAGVSACTHVQYCPNGTPPVMACQVKTCQQVMDTAARSGLKGFICEHLESVPFLAKAPSAQKLLSHESLALLIEQTKLLRPSRRSQCLQYQQEAASTGVGMVYQLPLDCLGSSRYLNFSVWTKGEERKKWWSFKGRVCVTYDTQSHMWHCKHVKGTQSCIHKTLVKWYMAETGQIPMNQQTSNPPMDEEPEEGEEEGEVDADPEPLEDEDEALSWPGPCMYPPQGRIAEEMSRYILASKKIPSYLPGSLTCAAKTYPKQ